MAGRNFYYDGDGDGIMDDVGYAYFPEDNYPPHHEHYVSQRQQYTHTASPKGSIFDYIPKKFLKKFIKSTIIAILSVGTISFIVCFVVFIIAQFS